MNCRDFFLFLLFLLLLPGAATALSDNDVAAQLRRLSTIRILGTEPLRSGADLARFYQGRDYRPVWSRNGELLPLADDLISALPAAAGEGLEPRTYHLFALAASVGHFRVAPTPLLAAELDLLFSDAFMLLSGDLLDGRIAPEGVDPDWHIPLEEGDRVRMLQQALTSGRIRDSLYALLPPDPAYAALRSAWQDICLLAAVGGWPQLTLSSPLRPGTVGAEVLALRRRLVQSGDLSLAEVGKEEFDADLEAAVRRFQSRHGLVADAIVGRQTLVALNVPAAERARQIAVNLERWRWLPRSFGKRYLRVNLPAFQLELVEEGKSVLEMRVIVGRKVRPTPVFAGRMTYLALNPYWEVPRNLAVADLLPKIQSDRHYLEKNGIEVFTPNGASLLDPTALDWQHLGDENFPFRLRQLPGPKNSLGKIKFIFPNRYNVYLHDTPDRKLFDREQRSFSSGCIRIEKPFDLAQQLLQGSALDSPSVIEEALQVAVNEVVSLPKPLPVYLLYFTVWVGKDGTVNFRPDLYQRDRRLDAALHRSSS